MKSALLSVGTEILFGSILNTNVQYLSEQLRLIKYMSAEDQEAIRHAEATGKWDDRLDALGLAVDDVGDGLHGAPRLAEEVELVEVQVFAQGDKLVDPGLLCPQFGVAVEVGIAAADLVVGDDLTAGVGDAV